MTATATRATKRLRMRKLVGTASVAAVRGANRLPGQVVGTVGAVGKAGVQTLTRVNMPQLMTGASVAAIALSAQGANAQVQGDSARTTVTTTGNATTVTTTNISNQTAFNRFKQFSVQQPNTTTMVLPTGVNNLVNVVAGDVRVDGALVSRMQSESGAVGGNMFFITSGGFMVGATGSINTGRLVVRGPDASGALLNVDAVPTGFDPNSLLSYSAVPSITVNGRINAPGGIDLKGGTVTIGGVLATGAAGVSGITAAMPTASVSTAGVTEGVGLVKVNGGIAIVGADAVTVAGANGAAPAALLDARATSIPGSLPGGIDIASNGQITLAGTLTAWDGSAAPAADIRVAATKTVTIDDGLLNGLAYNVPADLLNNYYTASTAKTGVAVTGAITGGTVSITADANASTASTGFDAVKTGVQLLENMGVAKLLSGLGQALDVFYTHTDATTAITVGSTAAIRSQNDLTLRAGSVSNASGRARIEGNGTDSWSFAIAVGVAQVVSDATVTIDGQLNAGGALLVSATNKATSKLVAEAVSTAQAKTAAVAYTDAHVDATVTVGAAAKLDGTSVTVRALNDQGSGTNDVFNNAARVIAKDDSPGGGVAAVSDIDIGATLNMAGTIGGGARKAGAVTLEANTLTNGILNVAEAGTGSGILTDIKAVAGYKQDMNGILRNFLSKGASLAGTTALDKGRELLGGTKAEPGAPADDGADATRFGAAVTVLYDHQGAAANVTGTINSTGAVAVNARVYDATVRNTAKATVAAEQKKDGEATSIAGAASWSDTGYTTKATVGGAVVAGSLAVNATTERPRGGSYDLTLPDGNSVQDDATAFWDTLKPKLGKDLGLTTGFFTSSAGAAASTESAQKAALSGTISFNSITADTRAWLNPLAQVTLGGLGGSSAAGALAVKATTTIVVMNLAGPAKLGFANKGGNAAGIAVGYTEIDPTTVAGIGKGVVVTRLAGTGAVNVDVNAASSVQAITLVPVAGEGNAKTGSGTFATNQITGGTRAVVSKDARLDLGTGRFGMDALTDLNIWAIGGSVAVTKADGSGDSSSVGSIGVAGAFNDVDFGTNATVGDAGADDAASAATAAAAGNAGVTSQTVAIAATDKGQINAISVAGAATSTTKAPAAKPGDGMQAPAKSQGVTAKGKGSLDKISQLLGEPVTAAASDYAAKASEVTDKVDGATGAAAQEEDKGTTPTKGFGVAGSASVNLSNLTTRVDTAGAKFTKADAAAPTGNFAARAVEAVDMMSLTGAAAITAGAVKLKDGNTLLSGAYGLSYSTNTTAAALDKTTLSGFDTVAVEAAANGSRIGAGLALSADTTKSDKGLTFAASVSQLYARDGAAASVTDGSITGGAAKTGNLSILAYDGLVLGAGAGGLSWGSSNAFGGAVTVVQVASPTGGAANAQLVRTPVSNFNDLSVRALTAARIAGIAAAGAANVSGDESKTALTIGMSVNLIDMDSTALIDLGATGTIAVGGAVNVYAGDTVKGQAEALATAGQSGGTAGASMLGKFALNGADFDGTDPLDPAKLSGGTQILSVAVPVSASKGKAIGLGLGWNAIDNDRTATVIGGSANGIKAGSLSVQAIEHSDVMALGVGVGASSKGAGLMGSMSRNLITGTSSATVGRSANAAGNLGIEITGAVGATPNVSIGALGDGGIFSLAGAVAAGKGAAGGIAASVNDITRNGTAGTAGLSATLDGVAFAGTPDVAVNATGSGRIVGSAVALAASSNSAAIAGAASANNIAPVIAANAGRLSYANATPGDLKVTASDGSTVTSNALVAGIGKNGGAAVGVSVNRIDADVSAALKVAGGDRIDVRNLVVATLSSAATKSFGLGAGGGQSFGGAGSVAVNLTDSDVTSRLSYTGGALTASGSVGVVARRDLTIDVGAGAVAGGSNAAIGAAMVINNLGGSADAQIVGDAANTGTLTAFAGSGDETARGLANLRSGEVATLPQFDALNGFQNLALGSVIDAKTTALTKGVAVNASTTAATRTIAITGAFAGSGPAIGITGVVNNSTGTTNAAITDTKVQAGSTGVANNNVAVDVRASTQQVGVTFAGAVAGGGGVAGAAPVISDGYGGRTTAIVTGGTLNSAGAITVKALANQSSTALAVAGAIAGSVGVAVAGVSPRFESTVAALVDKPTAVKALGGDGFAVNAGSSARALATFATLAGGGSGAGAAAVVVATNSNKTSADYEGLTDAATGLGTVTVDAPKVAVTANGDFQATVAGASAAAASTVALVGNGVGVVHAGQVSARADALRYDKATGTVTVKAAEQVAVATIVGQVAITPSPVSAAAALGAIAILSQSKVDAELARPSVVNAAAVTVDAKGYNQITAMQLGAAVGGVGLGANVTYIGIGAVTDPGALTATAGDGSADAKVASSSGSTSDGGNSNLAQLSGGGSTSNASFTANAGSVTTQGERDRVSGTETTRTAFGQVGKPGEDSAARVRALVSGNDGTGLATVHTDALAVDSGANLLSKSTNVQVSAGLAAGSATVGITRNAGQSIASLGNVDAWGGTGTRSGTVTINATTGEAAGTNGIKLPGVDAPTKAAEATITAGSVGIGALTVGVADVKLQSIVTASSTGRLDFDKASITASDTTRAGTGAIGVAAGAAAANVIISRATKAGEVAAAMSNQSTSNTLNVIADAKGGADATAYAGSGGLIYAGNAAVAEATDARNVGATVGEGALILSRDGITIKATSTPLVNARSFGIAISGGVAAGASLATATSSGTVSAKVGERGAGDATRMIVGSIKLVAQTLRPDGGDNVSANAIGSAGGYLAAANGSTAVAKTTLTTQAVLGSNLGGTPGAALIQFGGDILVSAGRTIGQYATATGVTAAGVLAIGIQQSEARSSGDTRAAIENVDGSRRNDWDASVASNSTDTNRATVTAGAGGLGAGVAATAITDTRGNAVTEVLTGAAPFNAGLLKLTADTNSDYRANSDSTLATVAGGSGTTSDNRVNAAAIVNIGREGVTAAGANTSLRADTITVKADSTVVAGDGGAAKGAGGGVVTGQAALLKASLNQAATVNLRDGVTLRQVGGDIRLNQQGMTIDAAVQQTHRHSVALDVGGVMQLPFGEVDGDYKANTAVNIGNNVLLRGDKGIAVGTNTVQSLQDTSAVQIYGLAGLGGGKVNSTTHATGNIAVGDGTTIESTGDIRLTTGRTADGVLSDSYRLAAQTDTFNNTALPLNSEASAYANVFADNKLTLGRAVIRSARDVVIESEAAAGNPSADGTGHNPYLELLSLTTHGGETKTTSDGAIALNGTTLIAGYLNDRTITIDNAKNADGSDNPNAVTQVYTNGKSTDGTSAGGSAAGTALAGSTGLVITTNDNRYTNGDPDALGGYLIGAGSFNPLDEVEKSITTLTAQADALGLLRQADGTPKLIDPATATSDKQRQDLRDQLNLASAASGIVAQLGTLWETRAALKGASVSTKPSVFVGGALPSASLFAAGGRISIGADKIAGTNGASVTAYGGPTVKIQNNTGFDTVLNNVFIPFKVDGAIDYTGKAVASDVTGVKLDTPGTGKQGLVAVETGTDRLKASNIVVVGTVGNIAGGFSAKTAYGNYVQFGQVNVANFSAESPNGLFTASLPNGTFSQGLPLAFWYGQSGTTSLYGNTSMRDAAEYVASYVAANNLNSWSGSSLTGQVSSLGDLNNAFARRYGYSVGDALTETFLNTSTSADAMHKIDGYGNTGTKFKNAGYTEFGGCLASTSACEIASPNDDIAQGKNSGDNVGKFRIFNGQGHSTWEDDYIFVVIPTYRSLVNKIDLNGGSYNNTAPGDATGGTIAKSQITATQVIINAQYVDVSGTITAGPIKDRSLTITDQLTKPVYRTDYVDAHFQRDADGRYVRDEFGDRIWVPAGNVQTLIGTQTASLTDALNSALSGKVGDVRVDLTQGLGGYGSPITGQNLGAQFVGTRDANGTLTGKVVVDDVVAAGGGSITIAGKILNTNPLGGGKLQVLNGYGNIRIDNQTGYDLSVGTINAGLSADGRITLRDQGRTTEYVNSVGGHVTQTVYAVTGYQKDGQGNNLLDKAGLPIPIAQKIDDQSFTYGGTQGLKGGDALNYQPSGNVYYLWGEHVQLSRGVAREADNKVNPNSGVRDSQDSDSNGSDNFEVYSVSAWANTSSNKQRPQVGQFIDLDAPAAAYDPANVTNQKDELGRNISLSGLYGSPTADAQRIKLALAGGRSDFVQVIDGKVTRNLEYHITDSDDNGDGFLVDLPTQAELNVLSAARATNPIRIEFDQGTGTGALNITSPRGNILVNGTLTFGGGTTSLSTDRSIVAGDKGVVISKNVALNAATSIGVIEKVDADGKVLTPEAAFKANLIGGSISATSGGEINLALKSVASVDGKPAPVLVDSIVAQGGVKISADSSLAGVDRGPAGVNVLSRTGDVTLVAGGGITGATDGYFGANNIASSTLQVDLRDDRLLTVTAGGDVAIGQGGYFGTDTTRKLRVGRIDTSGDVLLKVWGSVVAGDATATVDQAKLARFKAAAAALQLTPDCASSACGIIDPAALGGVDQSLRADAYAAFDKLGSSDTAVYNASVALLTQMFGTVPAGRGSIATLPINARYQQIAYQLRNQGREAYDRYALFNPGAVAEESRGTAVDRTVAAIDKIAAFGAKPGLTLSANATTVSSLDLSLDTLRPGGELYGIATSKLAAVGKPVAATATPEQLTLGLQLYLDDLRQPVASLLPADMLDLASLTTTAKATKVSDAITAKQLVDWVTDQNRQTQIQRASVDALGKLEQIDALRANSGLTVSADGKTVLIDGLRINGKGAVEIADPTKYRNNTALQAGGPLYELAVSTLRAQVNEGGAREKVPLPDVLDIQRGLQMYLTSLRTPLDDLLPSALPSLAGLDASAKLGAVAKAFTPDALTAWAGKQAATATTDLSDVFGTTGVTRATLGTATLVKLSDRAKGSTLSQTMLDVQVPSTAFVPVADSQISTRTPVIVARGVTLVAGNSVGDFDAQNSFTYTKAGYAGSIGADGRPSGIGQDLAAAYLASSGPGDLRTDIAYKVANDPKSGVQSISFTTRRDQPLQLNAAGTVNAVVAVDLNSIAGNGSSAARYDGKGVLTAAARDNSTVNSIGGNVRGDIFLNNTSQLTVGTIVSDKVTNGNTQVIPCNLGGDSLSVCDSRIRLVAPDIVGAVKASARVANGGSILSSGDGSALIMGGLVRIEASNGSVRGADGGAVKVDTRALEVLRAAGTISLTRRAGATIPYGGGQSFGNDLALGDVFAGEKLDIGNPYGSLQVIGLPSNLQSELRNSRIVTGVLSLRAAGDIGSPYPTSAGLPGQFDIQAPIIQRLVAGYDFANDRIGASGPDVDNPGSGSIWFALRGPSEIGADRIKNPELRASSMLGARGSITVGTIFNDLDSKNPIRSSVTFLTDITVGGSLNLTTKGDVNFPDETVRITGLGVTQDANTVDLRKLNLTLEGKFNYYNSKNILLGSLTAGGGTIESGNGYIDVGGTLFGSAGPLTPFTIKAYKSVSVGSTGAGSIALLSTTGDVTVREQVRATDLTIRGNNVTVNGGIYGRNADIVAGSAGIVKIGAVYLQRLAEDPAVQSNFSLHGGALTVGDLIAATDAVTIEGRSITAGKGATFLNTGSLLLNAGGALNLDADTSFVGIGSAVLRAGAAADGGTTVAMASFSGGSLDVAAPVGVTLGNTDVGDTLLVNTGGTLKVNGGITAGGAVVANAGAIGFAPAGALRDVGSVTLTASRSITAGTSTVIRSRGQLTITTPGDLQLGAVSAGGGAITVGGGLALGNTFNTTADFTFAGQAGPVSFASAVTSLGNLGITAGSDLTFGSTVAMNGGNGAGDLTLDLGGALIMTRNTRVTARAQTASVRVTAGSIAMDPLSSITGAAVSLTARGAATLGDLKANATAGQTVTVRSTGALSVGAITGGGTTLGASAGSVTLRNAVQTGTLSISARDDIATNGIAATAATLSASTGAVNLAGVTRLTRSDAPTAAKLAVTAAKGITVAGATSATGGIALTGTSVATTGTGYLTDTDLPGALTTLRADTANVTFTGGGTSPTAMRVDARGRTGGNMTDASLRFTGVRPIAFDALWLNKGSLTAASALSVASLTMRDYLLLSDGQQSVALQGATAAPAATRTVATGAMTAAKLAMTPAGGKTPAVSVNGVAK